MRDARAEDVWRESQQNSDVYDAQCTREVSRARDDSDSYGYRSRGDLYLETSRNSLRLRYAEQSTTPRFVSFPFLSFPASHAHLGFFRVFIIGNGMISRCDISVNEALTGAAMSALCHRVRLITIIKIDFMNRRLNSTAINNSAFSFHRISYVNVQSMLIHVIP